MADQNRNQSNQNTSRGQQGQHGSDPGAGRSRDDESIGTGESRRRSDREPAEMADDRGIGERDLEDTDELGDETAIESDVDDIDDMDEGGRSNR